MSYEGYQRLRFNRPQSPALPVAARRKNVRPSPVSAMCRGLPPLLCAMWTVLKRGSGARPRGAASPCR